jgi:ATP-dependent DNA helicase DinG
VGLVSLPRYLEDRNPAIPISAMVDAFGRQDDEVTRLLGPEGPIARALPGYQPRPTQTRFAQSVARALRQKAFLTAEAGTGTGKSIGYLVPAVAWAQETGETVLVCTATLALQDQLRMKDLPFLQNYLGIPFTGGVLKGKTNYACEMQLTEETAPLEYQEEWGQVNAWLDTTRTGDIGELAFDLKRKDYAALRQVVTVDQDECTGPRCPWAQEGSCWFYRARERAKSSDILVVNHALLALDLVLGGQLLPPYGAVIIDEAHQFESYVRGAMERQISAGRFRKLLGRVHKLVVGRNGDEKKATKHDQREDAVKAFFQAAGYYVRERLRGQAGKLRLNEALPPHLVEAAQALVEQLAGAQEQVRLFAARLDEDDPTAGKCENLTRGLTEAQDDLRGLVEPTDANMCLWAEAPQDPAFPPNLYATPISVAPFLKRHLFSGRAPRIPVILCSATLATSRDEHAFDLVEEALGIEHPLTLQVDSPYDYPSQALWYLPELPLSLLERQQGEDYQARAARHADAITPVIQEVVTATEGRALVLFTSYVMLREVHRRLEVAYPVRTQEEGSKGALIEWFKNTPNPVLLATASFFEGIDIPGKQLSCVIIDKIPFKSPTDPVEQAIQDRLGRQAFYKRQVPGAVMMLKQGVGRLIRAEDDRGLIVLLDPRFRGKAYGKQILAALPGAPEPDVTTLDPDSLWCVSDFIDGRAEVAP